jgi:hypothetical protein
MNKYLKHLCVIGCAVLMFLVRQPFALAQSSTNYTIQKDVMDQGGSVSSSENYQVVDAVGQPEPIGTSASLGYIESSGFFTGGGVSTGIAEEASRTIPTEFQLCQNYPNPFNPSTTIQFQIPMTADVVVQIYNIQGAMIKTLIRVHKTAGYYSTLWDGTDDCGNISASGIYLCRMEAVSHLQRFVQTKKLTFIR